MDHIMLNAYDVFLRHEFVIRKSSNGYKWRWGEEAWHEYIADSRTDFGDFMQKYAAN